jgi:hypothetical protein
MMRMNVAVWHKAIDDFFNLSTHEVRRLINWSNRYGLGPTNDWNTFYRQMAKYDKEYSSQQRLSLDQGEVQRESHAAFSF